MRLQTSSTVSTDTKIFDRNNPFRSQILSRHRLNKIGSSKETWHVVFDLAGSLITYRPGDSVGIYPENDIGTVEKILQNMAWSPDLEVVDDRTKQSFTIACFLATKANLCMPSKRLIQELAMRKKFDWSHIVDDDDALSSFTATHTVDELLEMAPRIFSSPQELVSLFSPLLPRFYSISSSQKIACDQVHCTIVRIAYEINEKSRFGLCSHFLCRAVEEGVSKVGIYIQPTKDFMLPEDASVPIIMIGPGTGVAPFRAFMQERIQHKDCTDKNWLFFGEREKAFDFYYEEFWQGLVKEGKLRLNTAFSRDYNEKEYVQHKMWENRKELWKWLEDGAKIYVCGDASRMAKDVDAMLQKIISTEANQTLEQAKSFCAKLRKEKRYLRDVY